MPAVGIVSTVEVHAGGYVECTRFLHNDGQVLVGGLVGSSPKKLFELKGNEYIQTVIFNHSNDELRKLQLITSTGRKSEVFGGKNCVKPDVTFEAPPGKQIVGLRRLETTCSKIEEVLMEGVFDETEALLEVALEEDSVDWESWSIKSSARIMVDNQQLHHILLAIKKQMESLRKKQMILIQKVQNFDSNSVPIDTRDESETIVVGASADDLRHAFEKIRRLEGTCNDLSNRIDELDTRLTAKLSTLAGELRKVSARIDNNSISIMENEKRMSDLEGKLTNRIDEMQTKFEQALLESQQQQRDSLLALEAKINNVSDVVALNDHRLRGVETKSTETAATLTEVKDNVETFPERYLDVINNSIVELYMQKADKSDLAKKADDTVALMKADQTEITRIEELCEALNRKVNYYGKEMQDGFATVDARLEKRMDKIAHWALRYLKREMKNLPSGGGGDDGGRDGTDIGRVRCLVCDQEVQQQRVTDIVFGGPAFKSVIPPHHRRSPSPPRGDVQENQSPPGRNAHREGDQRSQRATQQAATNVMLPKVGASALQHSKLVKSGAEPAHAGMIRLNNDGIMDRGDVEYVTDFNYRISTPQQQRRVQQQEERRPEYDDDDDDEIVHSSSAPALQVKNPFTNQPVGSGAVAAAAAAISSGASDAEIDRKLKSVSKNNYMTAQQENQQYFRDLEERFAGGRRQNSTGALRPPSAGTTRNSNSNNNSNTYTYNSFGGNLGTGKRPSTAPIKRTDISRKDSSSASKLKATGRPVNV